MNRNPTVRNATKTLFLELRIRVNDREFQSGLYNNYDLMMDTKGRCGL